MVVGVFMIVRRLGVQQHPLADLCIAGLGVGWGGRGDSSGVQPAS